MRILVFGAGAIGTYIGGSLELQGSSAVYLERPQIAAELRSRGLRLEMGGQERTIPHPKMASSIEEGLDCGPFDIAIFALKSYDTRSVLESMAPYASIFPPILCLQNGVDNEPEIAAVIGAEKVIPGTVTSAIARRSAGDIVLERLRGIGVAAGSPIAEKVVDAFTAAGLKAKLYPRASDMKWSKLVTNLLGNATSAILDMSPPEIFDHPDVFRLEIEQIREALRVMDVQGIRVVDLPGTPARALALAVRRLPLAFSRPVLRRALGSGRGGKMPSFHIDLHSGRSRSEVEYLNGAVVRYGELAGIAAPVNRWLTSTLLGLTRGELPLNMYARQPEKLVQDVNSSLRLLL